eukprot:TRINITY_DN216_c0_g2_i6.p1 TRINITY_DN216_c0_g2~~TRINITY_DN216_c0_g2_i6.p1  ORF type:complete len:265 (-),score=54.38 TRINITY_DN216_c0_g2_i6:686-1423(-)
MSQTSVQYACVVNYNTGGRIFVEAGNPGDKLRLNGFISAIVNKRPDPKGSFNQGETTFSYLKEGKLAFVSVSHPSVENDVIWGFLNELSSTKTEDKLPLQEALNQALHKYQGVKLSTQGTGLKSHEPVPVKEVVPEADPLTLVSNFFASVHDKMQKRGPLSFFNYLLFPFLLEFRSLFIKTQCRTLDNPKNPVGSPLWVFLPLPTIGSTSSTPAVGLAPHLTPFLLCGRSCTVSQSIETSSECCQ